jgi:glycosyltransferase involved in cell wall biosynthesis
MRLAFVSEHDARDVNAWSGIPYHMHRAFVGAGADIAATIGPLPMPGRFLARIANGVAGRAGGGRFDLEVESFVVRSQAAHIDALRGDADVIFSCGGVLPFAKLDADVPLAFWHDATFALLVDYYSGYSGLWARTIRLGHRRERESLDRAAVCIYSSQWAARSAVEDYGVDPSRIAVVQFGANFDDVPDADAVEEAVRRRPADICRLLFIGNDWRRKRGDFVVRIAETLAASGLRCEIALVGAPPDGPLPPIARHEGYLRKSDPAQLGRLRELLLTSHFFVLPARAECTPIAFSEAAAFGVPVLATDTGGVSAVIEEGINGWLFAPDATPTAWAERIAACLDGDAYLTAAMAARGEYDRRLNWSTAATRALEAIAALVQPVRAATTS